MGSKDLRSTTWYLNRVSFRTWDHFPVITKIEGSELKTKRRVWVGSVGCPCQKQIKPSFKNLFFAPEVTMAKLLHVRLKSEKDWSFYMTGWWVLVHRSELPRPSQGTETNVVCLRRSGEWRLTQLDAGIP